MAILVGPGYWGARAGWIGRLAGWIGGGGKARIDWSEVDEDRLGRAPEEATRPLGVRVEATIGSAHTWSGSRERSVRTFSSLQRRHRRDDERAERLGRCHDLRGEVVRLDGCGSPVSASAEPAGSPIFGDAGQAPSTT